jgi:hypothetical protein
MGRPPIVITDDMLRQIETLSGYGLTLEQCAAVIGVGYSTFREKLKDEALPEVSGAVARGRARAQGAIGRSLYQKANDGDVQAIKWWEATRAGRFASLAVVHQGDKDRPIKVNVTVTPHGEK